MINLILFLIGFTLGVMWREVRDLRDIVNKREVIPGVTRGLDKPANEYHAHGDQSNIVEPKTPQLVAWEAEQKLNKQNLQDVAKPK